MKTYKNDKFWFDRNDVDWAGYNRKFAEADEYLNTGYGNLRNLLDDPTTFCYLNFRIDGERLKFYPYQDMIAQDSHRFIFFRAANQIGKSLFLDAKAARNLIIDHGHNHHEGIISKSLPQSNFQMRRIKMLLKTMSNVRWEDVDVDGDSMSIITVNITDESGRVKYQNMLVCAPCTEGALGYDFHELNLDEFEFWKDVDLNWFVNQIAEPRTYHTKGRIIIFTNPNGADTYGAELEKLVLPDGNNKYHTYIFNFLDKPGNTEEELEVAKVGKTRAQIESTLLAIRTISDKNYFTREEIDRSRDKNLREIDMVGKQPFFFLDVGAKKDYSVFVAGYVDFPNGEDELAHIYVPIIHRYPQGYPLSRVVGSFDDKQDGDGWHYEKSFKDYFSEWSADGTIPIAGVDATGNSGIMPLFDSVGVPVEDVVFSGPVKSGMYQRFKYMMEKGLLHRVPNEHFDYEASHLEMRKSARGYLLIHHESENDHDDVVDAIAGLISLADPMSVPASVKII